MSHLSNPTSGVVGWQPDKHGNNIGNSKKEMINTMTKYIATTWAIRAPGLLVSVRANSGVGSKSILTPLLYRAIDPAANIRTNITAITAKLIGKVRVTPTGDTRLSSSVTTRQVLPTLCSIAKVTTLLAPSKPKR